MTRPGPAILSIVSVLGCGDGGGGTVDGGVASCTGTNYYPSNGQTTTYCHEVSGTYAPQLKFACPLLVVGDPVEVRTKAQYTDAACSRAGLVGGCRITSDQGTTTFWYYETLGGPSPDVNAICAMSQLTFVPP